jgi:hypothetical protein
MTLKEELAKIDGLEMTTIQWEEPGKPSHIVFRDVIGVFDGEKIMQIEARQVEEVKFNIENLPLPILNREAGLRLRNMFGGKNKEELLSPFDPEAKKTKREDMP